MWTDQTLELCVVSNVFFQQEFALFLNKYTMQAEPVK